MVLLPSYVFVWSIRPGVLCRWSSFRVVFLCGVLDQRCSVDGPPSKLCFCVEHQTRGVLQMVLLPSYVFVWSIRPGVLCRWSLLPSYVFVWSIKPEVFCRWSSFQAMFLCGALNQRCSVDGPPSKLCFCVKHQTRGVVQMVLLQSCVFVWSIILGCFVDGPSSKLCLCVEH